MLPQSRSYDELYREFRWQVPAQFNIGVEVCDRWAERDPDKLAHRRACAPDGRRTDVSYGWLRETSNRLANALAAHGIKRGDRVAILLPQAPEVAADHIRDLQARRRSRCRSRCCSAPTRSPTGCRIPARRRSSPTRRGWRSSPRSARERAGARTGALDRRAGDGALGFHETIARASSDFTPRPTPRRRSGDDDLHLGHHRPAERRAARASRAARPHAGHRDAARFLPAAGRPVLDAGRLGLGRRPARLLLPSLHYGVPVVARRFDKFDPEEAFALMAQHGVRNAFIPPTALRMLRSAPNPRGRHDIELRTRRLRRRGARRRDLRMGQATRSASPINEFYGQTECNLVLVVLRDDRRVAAGRDRQAGARPRRSR